MHKPEAVGSGLRSLVESKDQSAPRILLVTTQFPPLIGGVPSVYQNLCQHLEGRICVYTSRPRGNNDGWLTWDAEQRYPITRTTWMDPGLRRLFSPPLDRVVGTVHDRWLGRRAASRHFARAFSATHAQVVCFGTLGTTFWLEPVARQHGIPIVFYIHGEELASPASSRLDRDRPQRALQRADRVVAVSQFTQNALLRLGVDATRITVITNGVDTRRFQPGPKDERLLLRYGIRPSQPVLVTVGRLDERKGHDRVIEAMPHILRSVPDAVYVVVGEGQQRNRLADLARQTSVSDRVIFVGAVPDGTLAQHYALGDVFIMANRTLPDGDTEGFGLVFLEAGACGKPVIGGLAGGAPEAVLNGVTGLTVNGESIEQIAAAAVSLLSDPAKRASMGCQGLAHARANDWSRKAADFAAVMAGVAREGDTSHHGRREVKGKRPFEGRP